MSADGGRGHVHARERDRDRDRAPAPTPAASREAPSQPETATAPMTPISFAKAFGWGAGAGAGGTAPTPPPTPPPSPLGRPVAASDSAPERAADAAEARQRGAPDLTGVRVHTDARADGYARSLGADALTLGQDIFVARAAWNPGSAATNALLAHELHHAHHGQPGVVYRKAGVERSDDPVDRVEVLASEIDASPFSATGEPRAAQAKEDVGETRAGVIVFASGAIAPVTVYGPLPTRDVSVGTNGRFLGESGFIERADGGDVSDYAFPFTVSVVPVRQLTESAGSGSMKHAMSATPGSATGTHGGGAGPVGPASAEEAVGHFKRTILAFLQPTLSFYETNLLLPVPLPVRDGTRDTSRFLLDLWALYLQSRDAAALGWAASTYAGVSGPEAGAMGATILAVFDAFDSALGGAGMLGAPVGPDQLRDRPAPEPRCKFPTPRGSSARTGRPFDGITEDAVLAALAVPGTAELFLYGSGGGAAGCVECHPGGTPVAGVAPALLGVTGGVRRRADALRTLIAAVQAIEDVDGVASVLGQFEVPADREWLLNRGLGLPPGLMARVRDSGELRCVDDPESVEVCQVDYPAVAPPDANTTPAGWAVAVRLQEVESAAAEREFVLDAGLMGLTLLGGLVFAGPGWGALVAGAAQAYAMKRQIDATSTAATFAEGANAAQHVAGLPIAGDAYTAYTIERRERTRDTALPQVGLAMGAGAIGGGMGPGTRMVSRIALVEGQTAASWAVDTRQSDAAWLEEQNVVLGGAPGTAPTPTDTLVGDLETSALFWAGFEGVSASIGSGAASRPRPSRTPAPDTLATHPTPEWSSAQIGPEPLPLGVEGAPPEAPVSSVLEGPDTSGMLGGEPARPWESQRSWQADAPPTIVEPAEASPLSAAPDTLGTGPSALQRAAREQARSANPEAFARVEPYLDEPIPPLPEGLEGDYVLDSAGRLVRKSPKEESIQLTARNGRVEVWTEPQGELDRFDFGALLRKLKGDPPKDMPDPHAHHILYKEGIGPDQKALVQEGQKILRKYDIDPIYGPENLTWAPMRVVGQHDIASLTEVVEDLRAADQIFGSREAVVEALTEAGRRAAARR